MPQYNPLQFQTGLTGIAGAVGGPGFAEGGRQMGLSSRSITQWFNEQARAASKAASGMSTANLWGKGLGLLTMLALGPGGLLGKAGMSSKVLQGLIGAGVGAGVSYGLGKQAVKPLGLGEDPNILYGKEKFEAGKLEAGRAIQTLEGAVAPRAFQTGVGVPIDYYSLKMLGDPRTAAIDPTNVSWKGFEEFIKRDIATPFRGISSQPPGQAAGQPYGASGNVYSNPLIQLLMGNQVSNFLQTHKRGI